jgi:MFS family permease
MHAHPRKIHFYLNRDLGFLYASQLLMGAANSFVTLFVYLYIYIELGFPLWLVIALYASQPIIYGIFLHYGFKFSLYFGVKKSFAIGAVLNAIAITFLLFTENNHWLIIPFLLITTLYWLFYEPASSIDNVLFTQKKSRARQDSLYRAAVLCLKALIPLISGILIVSFGFFVPFICAIILSILAAIPILFSKDKHDVGNGYSMKSIIKYFKTYKNKREFIAHIADGLKAGNVELFWPIFIFIFIPSYVALGAITTIIILVSIALTLYLGQLIDKHGTEKILKLSAYGETTNWGIKAALWTLSIVTSFHILFVSITHRISEIMLEMTMTKEMFNNADTKYILEYTYLRKVARQIGTGFLFLFFALYAYFASNPEQVIIISFVGMGIASLTFPLMLTKKK